MATDNWYYNGKNGKLAHVVGDKVYNVNATDSNYQQKLDKYKSWVSAGQRNSHQALPGSNQKSQGQLGYDYNNGNIVNNVNGKSFAVTANDPRYGNLLNQYAAANGGIYPQGRAASPTGYSYLQSMLDESKNQMEKAAQGQIDASVNSLYNSIKGNNQRYDQLAAQQYAAKRIGEKNLGQQLATLGLGKTGMAESIALANENNYQNNLNSSEMARQEALGALDQQIAQVHAGGASTMADIYRDIVGQKSNSYLNLLSNDINQFNEDRSYRSNREQMAWQQNMTEKELAWQMEQAKMQQQLEKMAMQMSNGYLSPETRSYYGISSLGKSEGGEASRRSSGRSFGGNRSRKASRKASTKAYDIAASSPQDQQDNYDKAVQYLSEMVLANRKGGTLISQALPNAQVGQEEITSTKAKMTLVINDWLRNGQITGDDAKDLRSLFKI